MTHSYNELLISTMLNFMHYKNDQVRVIDSGKLEDGNAHYNGITWDKDCLYVSACEGTKYGYLMFTKTFEKMGFVKRLDLHETHQIIKIGRKLYFTNTGLNRIEWFDTYTNESGYKAFNESTHDVDHINGIWYNNKRFYVSEFRHKQKDQNGEQPSVVRICDSDLNLTETIKVGLPIHNIYVENGQMFNLVSRRAGLSVVDLNTKKKDFIDIKQLQEMLIRGLARTKDYWYIGASRWEEDRSKRHVGDAVIAILDNNFEMMQEIVIPNAGPLCDIRIIDEIDLAHNGVKFL